MTMNRRLAGALIAMAGAAFVLGACGAIQGAGSPSSSPQNITASNTPSPTATPLPPPIPPLLAYDSAGRTVLYSAAGTATATFPPNAPYQVLSPLGDRLLAEHTSAGHADGLTAISATGSTQLLEHFGTPADFADAIGARDGHAWAWMLHGGSTGCMGSQATPTTDVYESSTPGQSTVIAHLPSLASGASWTFYAWTKAGIVLREGGPPGCYEGPRFNDKATDLLDPATGQVTSLTAKMGSGCLLQDIADNGTIVCKPVPGSSGIQALTATSLLLRIVAPGGSHRDLAAGAFITTCANGHPLFGDVSIDDDGRYASLSRWCQPPSAPNPAVTTWIINTGTLAAVQSSVDSLDAAAWLPGPPVLIARAQQFQSPTSATYAIAVDGTATKLMSAMVTESCLRHF